MMGIETMSYVNTGPRGCGAARVVGGIYAELPLGPNGKPVEHFLRDPPIVVDVDALGLSSIGVKLIQDADGVWHILDRIGMMYYPNVADMIEEVRHMGMSRRIPANKGTLGALGEGSRILMVHDRGHIENTQPYYAEDRNTFECPQEKVHDDLWPMCAGLYWKDVQGGDPIYTLPGEALDGEPEQIGVERVMPSFYYVAESRPEGIDPKYKTAIFAAFPIANLAVVRGDDGEHERPAELAAESKLDVRIAND